MEKIVECRKIFKKYGRKTVLNYLDFEAFSGRITGILGPNGAGKTTLFKSILGLVVPNKGDVFLCDKKITHLPIHERALKGMAYLPQEPSVFRNATVSDNLYIIADILKIKDKKKRIDEIISDFGMESLVDQYADSLSGGEKRRLEFARTLLISPKVILLDEPFVGIDPITVKDIQAMVKKLASQNICVIITDHNVDDIVKIVDELYVVYKGNIIAHGDPHEVIEMKEVKDNYLGY